MAGHVPPTRGPTVVTTLPSVVRDALDRTVERVVTFVTLEAWSNLRDPPQSGGTPVKTGFARASWIPSVGESSSLDGGSKQSVSDAPAQRGAAEVMTYHLSQGAAFVTTNVWYVALLNDGSSAQAPAGFVDSAVARAVNAVENAFGGKV